jgi:hypothetical protein
MAGEGAAARIVDSSEGALDDGGRGFSSRERASMCRAIGDVGLPTELDRSLVARSRGLGLMYRGWLFSSSGEGDGLLIASAIPGRAFLNANEAIFDPVEAVDRIDSGLLELAGIGGTFRRLVCCKLGEVTIGLTLA